MLGSHNHSLQHHLVESLYFHTNLYQGSSCRSILACQIFRHWMVQTFQSMGVVSGGSILAWLICGGSCSVCLRWRTTSCVLGRRWICPYWPINILVDNQTRQKYYKIFGGGCTQYFRMISHGRACSGQSGRYRTKNGLICVVWQGCREYRLFCGCITVFDITWWRGLEWWRGRVKVFGCESFKL